MWRWLALLMLVLVLALLALALACTPRAAVRGGASRKWTAYETWEDLKADESAWKAYEADRETVLRDLAHDWSGVRQELTKALADNREWAGRINLVDGKLKIVELVASPYAIGEHVSGRAAAVLPVEMVAKLRAQPALFIFHTHPQGTCVLVSSNDAVCALLDTSSDRTAAHVIVTPESLVMYGASPRLRALIQQSSNPMAETRRRAFDLYSAMEGMRSWHLPSGRPGFQAEEQEKLMRLHGMLHVTYPLDAYAQTARNWVFTPGPEVDHGLLEHFVSNLRPGA